jgi:hypothetical protein
MPAINYGGPAFPRPASVDPSSGTLPDGDSVIEQQEGMSLRDYFAGQALVGLLAFSPAEADRQLPPGAAADDAYRIADAMLVARDRRTTATE